MVTPWTVAAGSGRWEGKIRGLREAGVAEPIPSIAPCTSASGFSARNPSMFGASMMSFKSPPTWSEWDGTCARADDQASKAARILGGSEQGCRGPHVRADEMGFTNL